MINNSKRHGFTLIELMLVMTGMSVLLLAILYATLHAGALYSKGITNRTVNQMSREMSDMFRRDFASVDPTKVQYIQTGTAPNQTGRICLGTVSYLWNTASLITTNPSGGIKVSQSSSTPLVFSRVLDGGSKYCSPAGGPYLTTIQDADINAKAVTDVLSGNGRDFAVYSLTFATLASTAPQGLYQIKLTVGTNTAGTTQAVAGGTQCRPPTDNSSDFNYCSVVDLDIIVRSGGKN